MTDSKDFLLTFTDSMKRETGKAPVGLYHALDQLPYFEEYHYDEEKKRLLELKEVLDKVLSIVYHPHIKIETEEVIKRSELAGKLSHDSFSETMRDPQLWKEKNGAMVPEYVHTVETLDSIETYENRFIALLIDAIEEDILVTLDNLSPMMESIEEHYQNKSLTFGSHSPMRDMRSKVYPYQSFLLSGNGNKEEILALARKIRRRVKNLKGTEFYKINHRHPISRNVMATNILIHDRLYSFCYRYYVNHYRREEKEERRKEISYFNYFFTSFLLTLKKRALLEESSFPALSFDEEDMVVFAPFSVVHYPFTLTVSEDKEAIGLHIEVRTDFDGEHFSSSYRFLTRTIYNDANAPVIEKVREEAERKDESFFLVTENNILKRYDAVLTFSYHREGNTAILDDLLSSLTILFAADKELYQDLCPVCGHHHIRFDGKGYVCQECHSEYVISRIDSENLLWIKSFRKE